MRKYQILIGSIILGVSMVISSLILSDALDHLADRLVRVLQLLAC